LVVVSDGSLVVTCPVFGTDLLEKLDCLSELAACRSAKYSARKLTVGTDPRPLSASVERLKVASNLEI
jgi:hypothetical protein